MSAADRARVRDPIADTPGADLVDLVRALVEVAVARSGDDACLTGEALLTVEVEGVRCTLVALSAHQEDAETAPLSPREQEIARMVARGYPNKTIASVLEISTWTVSTHLRRIFAKLGVRTRAAMVARLLEDAHLPAHDED